MRGGQPLEGAGEVSRVQKKDLFGQFNSLLCNFTYRLLSDNRQFLSS